MNLREGTRRLALLLGVVGAIAGGFASYSELLTVLEQWARHNRFEQLAASPFVQHAQESCYASSPKPEHGPWDKYQAPQQIPPPVPKGARFISEAPYCFVPFDDPNAIYYTPSESNSDGIRTVHFEDSEIAAIKTSDGDIFYPTAATSAWLLLLIVLYPILGFLIPWGAVRAIGWVLAGFFQPLKLPN